MALKKLRNHGKILFYVGRGKKGQGVFLPLFFCAAPRMLQNNIWKDYRKLIVDSCLLGRIRGGRFSTSAGDWARKTYSKSIDQSMLLCSKIEKLRH